MCQVEIFIQSYTFDVLYIIFMYATFLIKKGKLLAIYFILIVINILVMSCKIFFYKCVCVGGGVRVSLAF